MKKVTSTFLIIFFMANILFADIIYLNDGNIFRDVKITEEKEESITIEGKDFWKEIKRNDIKNIVKEAMKKDTGLTSRDKTIIEIQEQYKNPTSAFLWSFLITGAGQFYNGQSNKGFLMLVGQILLVSSWYTVEEKTYYSKYGNYKVPEIKTNDFAMLGSLFLWIVSMGDASATAKKINENLKKKYNLSLQISDTEYKLYCNYKF